MKFLVDISFFLDHLRTDAIGITSPVIALHRPPASWRGLAIQTRMTTRLRSFVFFPKATRIRIAPPTTSTICLARFFGSVSRLFLVSASNRGTAARIASTTPRNETGPLGRTKSRGSAAAHSVGRFIPCGFGGRTLQSQLLTNIYRPAGLLSNCQMITAPFLIR
jgi:hypothetical protein